MSGATGSRPPTGRSRPASDVAGSRPGSRPTTGKSRPSTALAISRPSTANSSRPGSAKAWSESETTPSSPRSEVSADDNPLLADTEEVPKGCWHSFTHCVGGMWSTREMTSNNEDREIFVRTTIRELVVYCIFIVVLCLVTFGMTSQTHYYYTKVMTDLFNQQPDVKNTGEFWDFMEGQLLDGLYWEYWYNNGDEKKYVCPGGEESTGPCPVAPSDRNILYENRMLGLPRIRQLRVQNLSCEIHPDFQNAIRYCYNEYQESKEDRAIFGPGYRDKSSASAWMYQTAAELKTTPMIHVGKVGYYSGGGAVQNLHSLKNESKLIIKELKEALWIGRGTRAVFVDFTVYNANINLFCVIKLVFEFPATGGVLPSSLFRTVKLIRYVNALDYFVMACEFIYTVFVMYYIVEEVLEIIKVKWVYFSGFWNNLDIVVILLCILNITLNLYTSIVVQSELKFLLEKPDEYADFNNLGYWSTMFKSAVAICVFFSWVKLFKYISFNKTMTQLASTLSRCAGDVAGFAVMFFIVFFAFAQLGYLLFGTQVEDFSSFSNAIFTLLRTILGDFNFHEIEAANRILGPIFFLSYVFFVFFVLLNMFLAIINDTYSEVKAEIAAQKNDFEIADYFKRGYNNMLGKCGKRSKLIDIENALKLANADGLVTYDEVRQNLKKCNFSDMEIEMFFAKYDVDGDGEFSMEEGANLIEDLDNDRIDNVAERPKTGIRPATGVARPMTAQHINHEEFGMLQKRVDRMEGVIGSIVSKIDMVLIKLESMEKSKSKKKQNLSKMFEGLTGEADDPGQRKQMEEMILNWDSESRPGTSGDQS